MNENRPKPMTPQTGIPGKPKGNNKNGGKNK